MEEEEQDDIFMLNPETKKGLFTLLLFVFAILFSLSFFDLAGTLGTYLNAFSENLIGILSPFLPIFLFFVALSRLMGKSIGVDAAVKLGAGFLLITLPSMVHLVANRETGVQFGKALKEGGGYVGMLISYLLEQGIGFWGAVVVLSAGILASLLLIFKTSLLNIVAPHRLLKNFFRRGEDEEYEEYDEEDEELEEDDEEDEEEEAAEKPKKRGLFAKKDVGDAETAPATDNALNPFAQKRKRYRKIALPVDLLDSRKGKPTAGDIHARQEIIEKTLENFGIDCEMGDVSVGPTVTQYTLKPADGVKLSRITGLSSDLALALAAHPIRIEAPIPGKSLVGIEVPNKSVAIVSLRDVVATKEFKKSGAQLPIALGMDVAGKPWMTDLAKMPHMLIAGSTGSGKTVCLNTVILSLLYSNSPEELKLILVDPKRVELPVYNNTPYMLVPAVTEVAKTVNALKWAISEMDRRFNLLSKFGKRDIMSYNASIEEKLPYIVVVVDELADLMVSKSKNEVENSIIRLAQMARAVGIHLILATQRPSVDVITGLIKANFTARIAFAVASATDSRTILDTTGAEKLVGRGDMLFLSADLSKPKRLQGAFVSDSEIKKVTDFIKDNYDAPDYQEGIVDRNATGANGGVAFADGDEGDELLPEAKELILRAGKASASLMQRRLKVGYARAARILDILEEQGFIGPANGAKPREILATATTASAAQPEAPAEDDEYEEDEEEDVYEEDDEGYDEDEYEDPDLDEDDEEEEEEKDIPWE